MPSDRYVLHQLRTVATLQSGPARPASVEIDYEGTAPPMQLFSHLSVLGFTGLVPQPPPAGAITWDDRAAAGSASPTIQPYRAVASGVLGGPIQDRDRALDATRLILERLTELHAAPGTEAPAPAAGPPPRSAPGPVAGGGGLPAPPPPDGADARDRTLAVVVDEAGARDVGALLSHLGTVVAEQPVTWTAETSYRGQKSQTHHRAVRFHATVGRDAEDALLDGLSRRKLHALEWRS